MIIDSHAHYTNNVYAQAFRYLTLTRDGYALSEGDRAQLFQELPEGNIPYSVRDAHEDALRILRWHPARKIGELKGISQEDVERATAENTIRLFRLPITETEKE